MLWSNPLNKGEVTRALEYNLATPVILHGSVESYKVSLSEKTPQKKHFNLATEVLRVSSTGVFNMFCVTHSQSNKNGN